MRVLITGISGFVGSVLANYLLSPESGQPLEIHGTIHRSDSRVHDFRDQLHLHKGDLRNPSWIDEVISSVKPEFVIHLAAWSDVRASWDQPWAVYELNISCQLNLLEALRRHSPDARVLVVASSEVYGLIEPDDLPVDESTPLRPNSPYGISKVAQDLMAQQYWYNYEMSAIRVRSFNHIGPGQSDSFVASAFARQIAEIESGLQRPVLKVGNLEAERDYTDVRDMVRAYWLALQYGKSGGVYNIGSGTAIPVQELLNILIDLSDVNIAVEQDPQRLRPSDVSRIVCDPVRFFKETGWSPRISVRESLMDVLHYWRHRTGALSEGSSDDTEPKLPI